MPVYLFWGEEEFNLQESVFGLRKKLLDPSWALLNHKIFNEPQISNLIEAFQTRPMFLGNMLIEVNFSSLFMRGGKKNYSSEKEEKEFLKTIENISENVHVLFVCKIARGSGKKVDKTLKLVKTIEKAGQVQQFNSFKAYQQNEIVQWINKRASLKNIKIASNASLALISYVGSDLRRLDSELDKLVTCIYPEKMIKKDHILALCKNIDDNIFLLAETWIKGDKVESLKELQKLLQKEPALKIIATLQTTVRRWVKIKIESTNKNTFEIAKLLNFPQIVIQNDLKKLSKISLQKLIELKEQLSNAEYKIKTGELEPDTALQLVICS